MFLIYIYGILVVGSDISLGLNSRASTVGLQPPRELPSCDLKCGGQGETEERGGLLQGW